MFKEATEAAKRSLTTVLKTGRLASQTSQQETARN